MDVIKYISIYKGEKEYRCNTKREAAIFINCPLHKIKDRKTINGHRVEITYMETCRCGTKINRRDDECFTCYYKSLVGKEPEPTNSKIETDNIIPRVRR